MFSSWKISKSCQWYLLAFCGYICWLWNIELGIWPDWKISAQPSIFYSSVFCQNFTKVWKSLRTNLWNLAERESAVGLAPYRNQKQLLLLLLLILSFLLLPLISWLKLIYLTCLILLINIQQDFELISFAFVFNCMFPMETFHISTMTQISSWWSWFSLWWTVEWLARQCSLTSEVIHSSCCQKGLAAIIGLWLCNIWNNQQRRRQILLLVSDFVRCTFKIVSFMIIVHNSYFPAQLIGEPAVCMKKDD